MPYRLDMPEEERKQKQREASAKNRAKQKAKRLADPKLDSLIKAKVREDSRKRRSDPEENARILANQRRRHAERSIEDPEYVEMKRESGRKHFWNNRESRLEVSRTWAEENDRSEYNLEWTRANPKKRAESRRRRKALVKGATEIETFSKEEIWERDRGICGICGLPANEDYWHLDHVIPLSRGGNHTRKNVQVSHPNCNLSKKAKLPEEMAQTTGGG